ncbi:PGF-CTERM sorting domain-containing protein [halophilic archaeon]|nr:PGF-CTERM sorting domain-containing protein [halophilic archaeon]
MVSTPRNRGMTVVVAVVCCLGVVAPVSVAQPRDVGNPCVGTVERPANGTTVVSVQGYNESGKQPAMLVGVGPRGAIRWVHHSAVEHDVVWSYDVDPMANGNVFVTAAVRGGKTLVYEFDPTTQETVWSVEFDIRDTHDADLIDGGSAIVVANMRNADPANGTNDDRIFVYNRTRGEITWEWRFADHYSPAVGGNFSKDWTHVNDVDAIGNGTFLVSPRNFDQVIAVDRATGEITTKLGEDGNHDVLRKQHNPDYLESENGTATLLVADSENDRVVEYTRRGDGWTRTWTVGSPETLHWPRDADRLDDGNTLVSDTKNQRVVEVTPTGEVVWEFYAPWLVYDAARLRTGEHGGPTIADMNATGTYEMTGSAGLHGDTDRLAACHARLMAVDGLTEAGRDALGGNGSAGRT